MKINSVKQKLLEGFDEMCTEFGIASEEIHPLVAYLSNALDEFGVVVKDEEIRSMCSIPNSVTITVVAKDDFDQDAIRKVITLEQVYQSSGVLVKHITEEAIRAIVESKVIQKTINSL